MSKTPEELQADIDRLTAELATTTQNSSKLVKEKRDALSRAEAAEKSAQDAAENASHANTTELEKAIKRAEKAEKAIVDAEARATKVEQNLRNTRADSALNSALSAANIDHDTLPYLAKAMKADIEFSDDGEPMLQGKSVTDYVKAFTAPKGEGHKFVRAPNNGGGAAVGYTGGSGTGIMTKETWNASKWSQIAINDPQQAKAIAIACGREDLARTL